ncbi:unnamed protein product [Spirodela intermedia]|uniref:Uncharacterized protein n=1 Tax=Spirodela intermedia TaxID=51605 RepID=A0A7I8IBN7_SPIIN|nr:unnamed protein product [Spirodela intermedia]CAA6654743.1 unnamed protein product [Spirodela intermedia]
MAQIGKKFSISSIRLPSDSMNIGCMIAPLGWSVCL